MSLYQIEIECNVRSVVLVKAKTEEDAIEKVLTADVELFNRYGAHDLLAGHGIERLDDEPQGSGSAAIISVEVKS